VNEEHQVVLGEVAFLRLSTNWSVRARSFENRRCVEPCCKHHPRLLSTHWESQFSRLRLYNEGRDLRRHERKHDTEHRSQTMPRVRLERIVKSAVVLSWDELMTDPASGLIHVEYQAGDDGSLDFLRCGLQRSGVNGSSSASFGCGPYGRIPQACASPVSTTPRNWLVRWNWQ
jgi:hypothetical protein